jgi:hypothetical protein
MAVQGLRETSDEINERVRNLSKRVRIAYRVRKRLDLPITRVVKHRRRKMR